MTGKRWLVITLILLLPVNTYAIKDQLFVYDAMINGRPHEVRLSVKHVKNEITVVYFNEFGDKETATYDDQYHVLRTAYFDKNNSKFATADYNYFSNKIVISNPDGRKEYIYKNPTYDNNGSIFHLFSVKQPAPKKKLYFHLCQTNMLHISDKFQRDLLTNLVGPVPMYLKYVKEEPLTINNHIYNTKKLELGISVPTIAMFWPNKYYFWYDLTKGYLVKYTGANDKGSNDVYTLKNVTESQIPMPELPSL